MSQEEQGKMSTPELLKHFREDSNAYGELAEESVWESWGLIVAIIAFGILMIFLASTGGPL